MQLFERTQLMLIQIEYPGLPHLLRHSARKKLAALETLLLPPLVTHADST